MLFTCEFTTDNYEEENKKHPFFEYPRPQFCRKSYFSLNGFWEYGFSENKDIQNYDGKILVPFCPESELSGVNRQLKPNEYLFYKKRFSLPQDFNVGRILLNVGACDQICEVFVNGKYVESHKGGYLPFSIDITNFLLEGENQEIVFRVQDNANSDVYGRGKQVYKPGGIWYKATSGLWQSVWLESVPSQYIKSIKYDIDFDNKKLITTCEIKAFYKLSESLKISVLDENQVIEEKSVFVDFSDEKNNLINSNEEFCIFKTKIVLDVKNCKPWTPDSPELYKIKIEYMKDTVDSYFGLRKFSVIEKNGNKFFAINNEPIFHNGLLDQGYWHKSYYTPPSNKAMFDEIKNVKNLGFNMLRKHIKVEPYLWYYYCDILGILVWQDMINGGKKYPAWRIALCPFFDFHLNDKNYKLMGRSEESRNQYYQEAFDMIDSLYNCVSLCLWTPFNEAWGQFDTLEVLNKLKQKDSSRLYDHASGWQDKKGGDVCSKHIYFRKARMKNDKNRVLALTEFGGYSLPLKNHFFASKKFGYKMFNSVEKLEQAYESLYEKEIIPLIKKEGLCGIVYTELTDVEDEINGIFTYDRVLKFSAEKIKMINKKLYDSFYKN